MSKVVEVANMMANNPATTVKDVMKKFKASKSYAYNLMTMARKQFINRRNEALAKPKARMQSSERKENWETVYIATSGQSILEGGPTEAELNGTDNVNHPSHYKTGGIETIDFIEAKNLNYHLGNVVKYITRADHKGDRLENLKKAQWYLNREIEKSSK
jgi:hypothetical protein